MSPLLALLACTDGGAVAHHIGRDFRMSEVQHIMSRAFSESVRCCSGNAISSRSLMLFLDAHYRINGLSSPTQSPPSPHPVVLPHPANTATTATATSPVTEDESKHAPSPKQDYKTYRHVAPFGPNQNTKTTVILPGLTVPVSRHLVLVLVN